MLLFILRAVKMPLGVENTNILILKGAFKSNHYIATDPQKGLVSNNLGTLLAKTIEVKISPLNCFIFMF